MTPNINFTFKHIDPTDAIKTHATKKFQKIMRLAPGAFEIQFIFDVDKLQHKAELIFHTNHGQFVSHHISEDLYVSIDGAVDKMIHQLTKDKDKHTTHRS